MRRYLETLFRYKEVFFVPALAMPLVALVFMLSTGRQYEVTASVWVEPSALLETSGRERVAPNEREAETLRERLETKSFRTEVMDRSGLTDAIQRGVWPAPSQLQMQVAQLPGIDAIPGFRAGLRALGLLPPATVDEALVQGLRTIDRNISVSIEMNNLMKVTYRGSEPELGKYLVDTVLRTYNEKILQQRSDETKTGIEFYTRQARLQEEKLNQAGAALSSYLEIHPEPFPGQTRPPAEIAELEGLRRNLSFEQELYDSSLRQLQVARVAGEASIANRIQGFQIIDPPVQPDSSGYTARMIAVVAIFGTTLGVFLGLIPIVFMTWLDGSVRTREDVEGTIRAPAMAQLPLISRRRNQDRDLLRLALARRSPQP